MGNTASFLRRLGFVLGVSLAGGYGVDYTIGRKQLTNATYCTARELIKPESRKERATLELCIAHEPLTPEESRTAAEALADARKRFSDEFGIDVKVSEVIGVRPYGDSLDLDGAHADIGVRKTKRSDAQMLLVRKDYVRNGSNWAGITNQRTNFVVIDDLAIRDVRDLSLVIQHEWGHLYYAEHESNPACIMFPEMVPQDLLPKGAPYWCDGAKGTILKYKHRIW